MILKSGVLFYLVIVTTIMIIFSCKETMSELIEKDNKSNSATLIFSSRDNTKSAILKNETKIPEIVELSTTRLRRRKVKRKRKYFKLSSQILKNETSLLNNNNILNKTNEISVIKRRPLKKNIRKQVKLYSNSTLRSIKRNRKLRKRKPLLTTSTTTTTSALTVKSTSVIETTSSNDIYEITTTTPKIIENKTLHTYRKRKNRCSVPIRGGCEQHCFPKGKIKCSCFPGFFLGKNGHSCYDINECKTNNGGCQSICKNTYGSFQCYCEIGMRISQDQKTCEDINECLLRNGHGPCQHKCINKIGTYECNCNGLEDTKLSEDGHSCVENTECPKDHGCSHICVMNHKMEFCKCPDGMELTSDWKSCEDINECEEKYIKNTCPYGCVNTVGSYYCHNSTEYLNDQEKNNNYPVTCKLLNLPSKGFYSCSRKYAVPIYSKYGIKRVINTPGTVCRLVCPKQMKIVGYTYLICGNNGQWEGKNTGKCV